jgi:hypothetical protein
MKSNAAECKDAQINEIQVLSSMLTDEDEFIIHNPHLLTSDDDDDDDVENNKPISFQFNIHSNEDSQQQQMYPICVKCEFAVDYPYQSPLKVYSMKNNVFTSKQEVECIQLVNEYLESLTGTESTFSLLSYLRDNIDEIIEKCSPLVNSNNTQEEVNKIRNLDLMTVGVHFHHIYSDAKKRQIMHLSSQLNLKSGLVKYGKPGRLIIQGVATDVESYLASLRSLRWQQMVVRVELHTIHEMDSIIDTDCNNAYQFFRKHGLLMFDSFSEVSSDDEMLKRLESVNQSQLFFDLVQIEKKK